MIVNKLPGEAMNAGAGASLPADWREMTAALDSRQMETLVELSVLLSAQMEEPDLLELVAHRISKCLEVDRCEIRFLENSATEACRLVSWGWSNGNRESDRVGEALAAMAASVLTAKRVTVVEDYAREADVGFPHLPVALRGISSLWVPLMKSGKPVGTLACHHPSPRTFRPADVFFLKVVANQLASTLENVQLYRKVAASEANLRALITGMRAILWEKDPVTLRCTYVSSESELLLGYPPGRWLEEPQFWVNHIHPEDRQRTMDQFLSALAMDVDTNIEYRMIKADGTIVWIEDIVNVQCVNGKPIRIQGVMKDVTENRQAGEILRQLEEQLRQSQKMETIGTLAGGIAHDFNNILTAVLAYAEMGKLQMSAQDRPYHYFEQVEKGARRAAALTRQLLAFSRRQVWNPSLCDLSRIVDDLSRMLRRIIGETVELHIESEHGLPHVLVDAGQMEQVLMNLCVNARDAMPDGGKLVIATRAVKLDETFCRSRPWMKSGDYVLLSVADDGMGMDEISQTRIFEPFFTTKDVGKGTGLGLSVVYGIVKQHQGLIEVRSRQNQGSVFSIYFPAQEEVPGDSLGDYCPMVRTGIETILLAEDDRGLGELASELLEGLGYEVLMARDGDESVHVFEAHRDRVSLAILDIAMPHCNGLKAFERMREIKSDLPVLFVTGYPLSEAQVKTELGRDYPILLKPYDRWTLSKRLREILD